MWYLLLILLIGVATAQQRSSFRDSFREKRFEYLVTNQNLHLDKLEDDLHKLEEEFGELSHEPDPKFITTLKARVSNLEGTGCPKGHQVPCGGDVPECISDLLFCDGHEDCKNGHDEDEEHCNLSPVHVGSSYTGLVTWTSCEQYEEPHNAVVTITSADRHDYFPSRVWIRGVISFEVDEEHHLMQTEMVKGYYNFGKQYLVMIPDKQSREKAAFNYGVRCVFNLGDFDHTDCTIVIPSSLHECGHFRASRYHD